MNKKTYLAQAIFTKRKKYGCFITVFYLIYGKRIRDASIYTSKKYRSSFYF